MSTVTTHGLGQTLAVLDVIRMRLSDFRTFWPGLEARIPALQTNYWNRRFYRGFRHAPSTVEARRRGLGNPIREASRRRRHAGRLGSYYDVNRPGGALTASDRHPYFYWTGRLLAATQRFTLRERARAAIEAEKNYQGPLRRQMKDPVGQIVERRVSAWDERALDRAADALLETWALEQAQEAALVT